ncbi:hypothetical protein SAMN05216191_12332 [Paenibacillus jilunlii]|uniref:Uncharacterized protein n=2 Tax=Paenibacillus jilunlii TaxID=682956 RepID=A0A1G9XUB6_9BACL|nr:hypothetical protein AML91_02290 [Paenibacillus jilunlii]SDN00330.1 hypothetical protein SAMN05216191_12332 [Paenibacillus jilunlii]
MEITTTNSQQAFEQLKRHEADVAFYGGGAQDRPEDIDWLELFEDELWFRCPLPIPTQTVRCHYRR